MSELHEKLWPPQLFLYVQDIDVHVIMIVQTGHQVGFARIDQHRLRLHRVYFALKVDKQVAHKFVRRLSAEVVAVRDEVRQGRAAISLQREAIELIL